MNKKICLFHPWIKSKGGAERVVLELMEKSKHKIDLFTWFYDEENTFSEFQKYKINVIAPKFAGRFSRNYLTRSLVFILGMFKKIPLENYDKFLISTSGVGEFITFRNYKKGQTYAYIHTPLRHAQKNIVGWNLENKYKGNFLKKQIYLISVKIYKILEKIAWKRLDVVIFNSKLSKQRAEEHNLIKGKKTKIIHPPIERMKLKSKRENCFVYVSRLNEPKRQDILLEVWKKFGKKYPDLKLLIVGTAENKKYFEKLKELATENVKIKTNVGNKELKYILSNSKAGIFLGYQEDFGITPIQILLAGKPLIAVDEGGYVDLIKNHPQFYKIREKHNKEEMIIETENVLERFMVNKTRKKGMNIKLKDFTKEMDKYLNEGGLV